MKDHPSSQFTEKDVLDLLDAWPLLRNPTVKSTNKGTVNTTFFVETQTDKFVLKLYDSSVATTQIYYEHALLAHMQRKKTSFQIPMPVPTTSGETLLSINDHDAPLRVALIPFISGQPAKRGDLTQTHMVGQTLGELHHTLVDFDTEKNIAQLPSWGKLNHLHPLVKDPLEIVQLLELNSLQKEQIDQIFSELIEAAPRLYETLPVQTIHADFLCPNVLFSDDRIAGVLDFEFATLDLRLIDYAIALDHFTRLPLNSEPKWDLIEAFSAGYSDYVTLSQTEIEALSLVWCLQQASSIVYWAGWFLEGKVTRQSVLDGVTCMITLKDWLEENTAQLVRN